MKEKEKESQDLSMGLFQGRYMVICCVSYGAAPFLSTKKGSFKASRKAWLLLIEQNVNIANKKEHLFYAIVLLV